MPACLRRKEQDGREESSVLSTSQPRAPGKSFAQVLTYFAWQKPPPSFTKGGIMAKCNSAGCENIALHGSQRKFGNTTVGSDHRLSHHEGKPDWGSLSFILQHRSTAAPSSPSAWPHKHPRNEILSTTAAEGKSSNERRKRLQSRQRDRAQVTIKTFCQNFFPPTENKVFNQTLSG